MFDLNKTLNLELNKYLKNNELFVYQPREDSNLLLKNIDDLIKLKSNIDEFKQKSKNKNLKKISILEIGVGSGFCAFNIIKNHYVKYDAVDINEDSINFVKSFYNRYKSEFKGQLNLSISNLFSKISLKNKYDFIIFNPPYLPYDNNEPKKMSYALSGGKKGYELTQNFIIKSKKYLGDDGKLIFIVSSLSDNPITINQILNKELFDFNIKDKSSFDFETIYLYSAKKNELLNKFKTIKFFSQGKHSYVYKYKNIAIKKLKLKDFRFKKEKILLKKINAYNIGPKYVQSINGFKLDGQLLGYEFIEGIPLKDYLKEITLQKIKKVNQMLFNQIILLDFLGIKKEELTKITTNAIISNDEKKITLIDFERSHFSLVNHNFTQYFEFIKNQIFQLGSKFKIPLKITTKLKKYKSINKDKKKLTSFTKPIINELFLYANVIQCFKKSNKKTKIFAINECSKKYKITKYKTQKIINSIII